MSGRQAKSEAQKAVCLTVIPIILAAEIVITSSFTNLMYRRLPAETQTIEFRDLFSV